MQNDKNFKLLLTPSWLSNFVAGTTAVLVTAGAAVLSRYQNSELRQQVFENEVNARSQTVVTDSSYQAITDNVAGNSFLGSLPLLLTWAAVGLVVYFFATAIARALGEAVNLRDQVDYVNTERNQLIKEAVVSLAIRAAATIGWFIFIKISLSMIVPYVLASASLGARSLSLANVGYLLLAAVVLFATVYLHTLFVRLIVLKPRLFSN